MDSATHRGIRFRAIEESDAGQVLTVQRAAFVTEARIYGTVELHALTETLEQLRADLADNLGCVAAEGDRIVGVARARASGTLLLIGRIAIAPDAQGTGIGSALLAAVESRGAASGCREAELFTGSLSVANLELYTRLGYQESERVASGDGVEQVFLRKTLSAGG